MTNKKKILLVEDDIFISDMYKTKFIQEGFEVSLAENGAEGLNKLKEFIPDVMLIDIVMPYMGGVEMLTELKKNSEWKKIPVIMLTNISEKEKIAEIIQKGANDYIVKSHFTPSEVVAKVRALLEI